jgi:hypothetical protein
VNSKTHWLPNSLFGGRKVIKFQELKRDGWSVGCPFCKRDIRYTLINNQQSPIPFYYSQAGNDILLRKQDELSVQKLFSKFSGKPTLRELEKLWLAILESAPDAPHGGKFGLWSNVKCTHCHKELPYNDGVKNLELRIYEPKIVAVDGAILMGDSPEESWQVKVRSV